MKKYLYCPQCGTKGSVAWKVPSTAHCSQCGADIWNNPVATVAVIFLKDGEALFAKRGIEPNKGKYDFPGGFVEYNEDAYEACVREIKEETSVDIRREDLKLLTAYSAEYLPEVSVVDLVFTISTWKGNFQPQDDVADLEWKPVSFVESDQFATQAYTNLRAKLAELE